MAASNHAFQQEPKHVVVPSNGDMEQPVRLDQEDKKGGFDYAKRAPWLRAAVLGANDGLVSIASLMMGVGTVKQDIKAMILTGFAGMVAGACSMAIGEFVSVYSQRDIEVAQMKRNKNRRRQESRGVEDAGEEEEEIGELPNPMQAAAASVVAFAMGAMVPLLAASFIKAYKVRIGVVIAAVTVALVVCGWLGAALGGAPKGKASLRVLIGGWLAMAITSGLTKLIGLKGE